MLDQTYNLPQKATEVLGDLTALAEQLGRTDGICQLPLSAVASASARIESPASLDKFLDEYVSEILIPHELPVIAQAYGYATRYEVRELIAFDRELESSPGLKVFGNASRMVGRAQLQRLRPLRSERLLQRYLRAVEESNANAWHTVIYGVVLALYSMPLRQGLLHFARQTLTGFMQAASGRMRIDSTRRQEILAKHSEAVAAAIEATVNRESVKRE